MTEPRIQYAKTEDGVSIAFSSLGDGKPLVQMVSWSHLQLEWQVPELGRWYERLAEKRMLVRYDDRGTGLSERDVTDLSLEARILDLEAVVDRLGLETLALLANQYEGPVAIAYAARHPKQVSRLILWCSFARVSDAASPQLRGLGRLLDTNWELYTETMAHAMFGWSEGEPARRWAALLREGLTHEEARAAADAMREWDVTDLLPNLRTPTLVLHRRQAPFPDVRVARQLAATIPDARLALLEGASAATFLGDMDAVLTAIDEFLSEGEEAEPKTELPSGTAIILFADIVDSTALTERLGDAAFRAKARDLDIALRKIIREAEGTPVEGKLLGDGVLAVFTSARQAIEAAMRFGKAAESVGLGLHLGIHAGDVIEEDGNVFGGAVNIAARVAAESAPGEVLVSQTVRDLARTSAGVEFEDAGERTLKGVGEPVRVWRVRQG